MTEELKLARSSSSKAVDGQYLPPSQGFRLDDEGPYLPMSADGKEGMMPEVMVKWLRGENERLKYGLRKAEEEVGPSLSSAFISGQQS